MTTYQVELQDGSTINNLTFEEANKLFFSSVNKGEIKAIRPWPVQEYKAP